MAREGDQREVCSVQHDLEREEDDQRIAPEQHTERADAEQEAGDAEVPGDVRTVHRGSTPCSDRRECEPRMTPPMGGTGRTREVIGKGSRGWVGKGRPM